MWEAKVKADNNFDYKIGSILGWDQVRISENIQGTIWIETPRNMPLENMVIQNCV